MRVRRTLKPVLFAALVAIAAIIITAVIALPRLHTFSFARSVLPYPTAWDQIREGDSVAEVTVRCPDHHTEGFKRKGRSWYYDRHLYGFWSMYVVYDAEDRVQSKRFRLRLGTRQFYRDYVYGSDV